MRQQPSISVFFSEAMRWKHSFAAHYFLHYAKKFRQTLKDTEGLRDKIVVVNFHNKEFIDSMKNTLDEISSLSQEIHELLKKSPDYSMSIVVEQVSKKILETVQLVRQKFEQTRFAIVTDFANSRKYRRDLRYLMHQLTIHLREFPNHLERISDEAEAQFPSLN